MKTIIAKKSQHGAIAKLFQKDNEIINNISIIPLFGYLNSIIEIIDNNYDKNLKEVLSSLKLQVLNTYTNNQTFINEIKRFHISMYLYDIKVEDLPNETLKDQDLKLIYQSINTLIPQEIENLNKLKTYLENNAINNLYISKSNYSEYEEEIINLLINHNAKILEEHINETKNVNVYFANNIRSEIESSAQLITKNKLKNALVIALNNEYLPLINQVYNRYNIDYNTIDTNKYQNYTINFISIIKLIKNQDHQSLLEFLSSNPFNLENINDTILMTKFFKLDLKTLLNYENITLDDPLLYQSNIDYYIQIRENAYPDIIKLQSILNNFTNLDNLKLLEEVFNYLLENHYHSDLNNIKNTLFNNKEVLIEDNLVENLNKLLLRQSSNIINPNKVVVTTIFNHYYFNNENVIILGATNKNYPNIKKLNGVVDEKYVTNLNYPSKTMRFDKQLKQYEDIKKGININIFYPLAGYDGKGIEPSFSLLNFAKQYNTTPVRYPLIENDKIEYKQYKLDKDIAQKLFFKDNKLYGSVSSFEKYNRCPYAYFLQYGLNIWPKQLPDHSSQYLGTLTHSLVEHLVNQIIENKPVNIKDMIDKAFIPLKLFNDPKTNILKLQIQNQVEVLYNRLKLINEDTLFKPYKTEERFNYEIVDNVFLSGVIDRIDIYDDYLRVVDYKSSSQRLSEKALKEGLQLQLLTYLLVATQKYNKKPSGAFYNTLRIIDSTTNAAKVSKMGEHYTKTTIEDIKNAYLQKNRMLGWHFIEPLAYYKSADYISDLYINSKQQLTFRGKPYNFETVINILEEVYRDIYNNLKAGYIDCLPVNNPCQFCNLQSICQTNTSNNYKPQIYYKQNLKEETDKDVYK